MLWIPGYQQGVVLRLPEDCTDVQADMSPCWAHMQTYSKCYSPAHIRISLHECLAATEKMLFNAKHAG